MSAHHDRQRLFWCRAPKRACHRGCAHLRVLFHAGSQHVVCQHIHRLKGHLHAFQYLHFTITCLQTKTAVDTRMQQLAAIMFIMTNVSPVREWCSLHGAALHTVRPSTTPACHLQCRLFWRAMACIEHAEASTVAFCAALEAARLHNCV